MRRVIMAVLLIVAPVGDAVQARGLLFGRRDYAYGNYAYGNSSVSSYDAGYGRRLRGGFGRNGYAPTFGPLWGPESFGPVGGVQLGPGPYDPYEYYAPLDEGPMVPHVETPAEVE